MVSWKITWMIEARISLSGRKSVIFSRTVNLEKYYQCQSQLYMKKKKKKIHRFIKLGAYLKVLFKLPDWWFKVIFQEHLIPEWLTKENKFKSNNHKNELVLFLIYLCNPLVTFQAWVEAVNVAILERINMVYSSINAHNRKKLPKSVDGKWWYINRSRAIHDGKSSTWFSFVFCGNCLQFLIIS